MQREPVHRAIRLGEAANELMEAKYVMAQLESSEIFRALSTRQKRQYHEVLNLLRDLIHDFEQDTAQEQLAS
jgi:hypothetical protein